MFSLLLVLESDFAKKKRSDRPSNTALPKRDAPISLGSLQVALCSTMCKVICAMQYNYSHLYWKGCDYGLQCGQSTLSYLLCLISALNHLYVMGQSGVVCTAWLGHWGTLMLWCTVWLVVNWYLDALCGWNTQIYPVLMHWCALWLMMNSIDDYIAICTAHTLIAWCVFCFS